ncbi:hypothetical protein K2224_09685 [Streptomyces sp. BHT-5-2]|uniref:hypothetical protein n=1 Tax=unclassified Streptomyces TaxID=2593676 RepID=UPI001C8D8BD7|nr:hypothetical protein [Streptomyces sp. BHT-5-2]QZL03439.1 hypothetical protein K2224_09685 [Streptomyces sp. BHT-5-2]
MTAALISRGKGRRAAAALGAVTLGLLTLSACQQPTSLATVTVGSDTVTAEVTPGCDGNGKSLDKKTVQECISKKGGKTITVRPGERIRVGVDPKVAKAGWFAVGGGPVMAAPSTDTYRTFSTDELFKAVNPATGQSESLRDVTLMIAEAGSSEGAGPTALWHFDLKLKD